MLDGELFCGTALALELLAEFHQSNPRAFTNGLADKLKTSAAELKERYDTALGPKSLTKEWVNDALLAASSRLSELRKRTEDEKIDQEMLGEILAYLQQKSPWSSTTTGGISLADLSSFPTEEFEVGQDWSDVSIAIGSLQQCWSDWDALTGDNPPSNQR